MDREFSAKVENKPVDDRPGRQLPPPRGSGGHGVNEMKANNVLFSDRSWAKESRWKCRKKNIMEAVSTATSASRRPPMRRLP